MQFVIYALLGIIILMLCFVIFLLGRLYEENIFKKELTLFLEWLGEEE